MSASSARVLKSFGELSVDLTMLFGPANLRAVAGRSCGGALDEV